MHIQYIQYTYILAIKKYITVGKKEVPAINPKVFHKFRQISQSVTHHPSGLLVSVHSPSHHVPQNIWKVPRSFHTNSIYLWVYMSFFPLTYTEPCSFSNPNTRSFSFLLMKSYQPFCLQYAHINTFESFLSPRKMRRIHRPKIITYTSNKGPGYCHWICVFWLVSSKCASTSCTKEVSG